MNYVFLLAIVLVAALTCTCQADDTFAVTRTSIVSLGAEGGDTFSFERISPEARESWFFCDPGAKRAVAHDGQPWGVAPVSSTANVGSR